MLQPPAHPREIERLAELRALHALDGPADATLDRIADLARRIIGFPIAFVSLIDADRLWFRACSGQALGEGIPRDQAFCAWTILGAAPLVVPDMTQDARFAGHPLVSGPPFVRAYCGIPLMTAPGLSVGTLCAIAETPTEVGPDRVALLQDLAVIATDTLRQQARNEAVSVMSHEIRATLHGVVGLTDMLHETTGLPSEVARNVSLLSETGRHLLQLTTDALEYSRLEAGRLALEAVAFDPAAEIASVLALLRPRAEDGRVNLRSEIGPEVPQRVLGDPGRLRQVLVNLVGNAIKFATGGDVTIALHAILEDVDLHLVIEVSDTGVGMTPDELARLFEAFSQAQSSTARHFGGSGLGLVICRRLVELMGGSIRVESTPGHGSKFRFDVRVMPATQNDPPKTSGRTQATLDVPPLRVLLADDNAVVRIVTSEQLRRLGHSVQTVEDGAAAVDAVRSNLIDVVLLDMQMPGLNGPAAARAIRALPGPAGRVCILGTTADDTAKASATCLAAGMDAMLRKPITNAALAVAIKAHVSASTIDARAKWNSD